MSSVIQQYSDFFRSLDYEYLSTFVALTVLAVIPIYTGSHNALVYPKKKSGKGSDDDSDDEDDKIDNKDLMTLDDAYWFPVFGSITLLSLYLVFKYVNKYYIDIIVSVLFSFLGAINFFNASTSFLKLIFPKWFFNGSIKVVVYEYEEKIGKYTFGALHGIVGFITAGVAASYGLSKHWILSNLLGESFAFNAIQLLNIDRFITGIVLLSCLFFYDIFWVFGTEVMVSVARNFDAPVKVLWPKYISEVLKKDFFVAPENSLSLLGLGDIVIPGVYIAFCLKFDHFNYLNSSEGKKNPQNKDFPKPYFHVTLFAYILGLITTYFVMIKFNAAQPALLYLSPGCIISSVGVAVALKQLEEFWKFTTNEDDETDSKSKKKTKSKGKSKAKVSDSEDEEERHVVSKKASSRATSRARK